MAQHWWVLEELGDLGELDALLADDTGACRAAPGASKGPEGSSGAPLTPSEADDDACAVAPGVDTTAAPTPTASGDNACETEPVGVDSAAAPTTAPPGSPAAALKLRCLDERHPATCARCVRVPHMPLRRRQAAPILLFSLRLAEPDAARARAAQLRGPARRGRAALVQADGRPPKEERCGARGTCARDARALPSACARIPTTAAWLPQARRSCAACSRARRSGKTRAHARSWCVPRAPRHLSPPSVSGLPPGPLYQPRAPCSRRLRARRRLALP